jgi:hypothetical protein
MMETELVSETLVFNLTSTWLVTQETPEGRTAKLQDNACNVLLQKNASTPAL